jgi:hypothetical protein
MTLLEKQAKILAVHPLPFPSLIIPLSLPSPFILHVTMEPSPAKKVKRDLWHLTQDLD